MFSTPDAARRRGSPQRGSWNRDLRIPAAAGLAGLAVMVATAAIAPAARTTAVMSASATVPQLAGITVGIDGMRAVARGLGGPQLDPDAVDQARSAASERSMRSAERTSRSAADARRSGSAADAPTSASSADALSSAAVSAAQDAAEAEAVRVAEAQAVAARVAADQEAARVAAEQAAAAAAAQQAAAAAAAAAEAERLARAWVVPTSGYRLTARFGAAGRHWANRHSGLDFAAAAGTPVVAVHTGAVVSAGWAGAYGNRIVVRHAGGIETWYCHLSAFAASAGQQVGTGHQIGRVGSTGNTTGPHLHLEVRRGGSPVDPAAFLADHGAAP